MTTTIDQLRDIQRRATAGEPITDEERELISTAMIKLVQAARAADDGLVALVDAFSAFGKALTDACARIREANDMPVIRFPQTRGSILRNFHPTLVYPSDATVPTPQTGAHRKDAL